MSEEEKTYDAMRKEFYVKFRSIAAPEFQLLEKVRRKKLYIIILISIAMVSLGGYLRYVYLHNEIEKNSYDTLMALIVLAVIFSYGIIEVNFIELIKEKVMPTFCNCFENMNWHNGEYSPDGDFSESYVFKNYKETKDDVFSCSYKNMEVDIAESCSGKKGRGNFIKIKMDKVFPCHMVIKHYDAFHCSIPPSSKLRRVKMDNSQFFKRFHVYADNEAEARSLMGPPIIEMFNNIIYIFRPLEGTLCCEFYRDSLMIGLFKNRSVFSIGALLKPVDEQYLKLFDEINSILELADSLRF